MSLSQVWINFHLILASCGACTNLYLPSLLYMSHANNAQQNSLLFFGAARGENEKEEIFTLNKKKFVRSRRGGREKWKCRKTLMFFSTNTQTQSPEIFLLFIYFFLLLLHRISGNNFPDFSSCFSPIFFVFLKSIDFLITCNVFIIIFFAGFPL